MIIIRDQREPFVSAYCRALPAAKDHINRHMVSETSVRFSDQPELPVPDLCNMRQLPQAIFLHVTGKAVQTACHNEQILNTVILFAVNDRCSSGIRMICMDITHPGLFPLMCFGCVIYGLPVCFHRHDIRIGSCQTFYIQSVLQIDPEQGISLLVCKVSSVMPVRDLINDRIILVFQAFFLFLFFRCFIIQIGIRIVGIDHADCRINIISQFFQCLQNKRKRDPVFCFAAGHAQTVQLRGSCLRVLSTAPDQQCLIICPQHSRAVQRSSHLHGCAVLYDPDITMVPCSFLIGSGSLKCKVRPVRGVHQIFRKPVLTDICNLYRLQFPILHFCVSFP